jgi:MoxR-like ATPase
VAPFLPPETAVRRVQLHRSTKSAAQNKCLSGKSGLKFRRVQFTPDLMPADIAGSEILEEDRTSGRRELRFREGPIFTNILLADEINRTPPKTQAALLEAMQEHQVTVSGSTYHLKEPFL